MVEEAEEELSEMVVEEEVQQEGEAKLFQCQIP
jgi:hypothetical protein